MTAHVMENRVATRLGICAKIRNFILSFPGLKRLEICLDVWEFYVEVAKTINNL